MSIDLLPNLFDMFSNLNNSDLFLTIAILIGYASGEHHWDPNDPLVFDKKNLCIAIKLSLNFSHLDVSCKKEEMQNL